MLSEWLKSFSQSGKVGLKDSFSLNFAHSKKLGIHFFILKIKYLMVEVVVLYRIIIFIHILIQLM